VLWIGSPWAQEQLHAEGVLDWIDPARLIFVHPRRTEDLLWTMEEVLRAGCVAFAVADLPGAPGLTQVRRMHLAAETGATEGRVLPLGLLMTPGDGGAQGVETRWNLRPDHAPGRRQWRLERVRARTAPRQAWTVRHDGSPGALRLVTG
jgi:protein ImuA